MTTEGKVDGYVRVSRIGGRNGEGYISPDVQREQITEYAQRLGLKVAVWHSDEDYSGGNTQRPGFQEAIRRIEANETGGLIVAHTDRFSRSVADGSATVRRILNAGGVFASALEHIDPRTPSGQYMLNSFLNNAELALNNYKAGWRTAKARAVERGAHIGRTPFGYARTEGRLFPNNHAPAVRAVYQGRLAGRSYSELARTLDRIAPKAQSWQNTEVKRMLRNRTYLGEISYRGAEHDLSNPTGHEPIIDHATFQAVAKTLKTGTQLRPDSPFLLGGMVRCAHCRYSMSGQTGGGVNRDTPIYRCTGRARCDGRPVITAHRVEPYVISQWREQVGGAIITGQPTPDQQLADLAAAERRVEAEIETHLGDLALKRRLGERWRSHLDTLLDEQETLMAEREEHEARAGLAAFGAIDLDRLDPAQLRVALRGAVQHIFIRSGRAPVQERVGILWAGEQGVEVPSAGKPGPFGPVDWERLELPARVLGVKVGEQGA